MINGRHDPGFVYTLHVSQYDFLEFGPSLVMIAPRSYVQGRPIVPRSGSPPVSPTVCLLAFLLDGSRGTFFNKELANLQG